MPVRPLPRHVPLRHHPALRSGAVAALVATLALTPGCSHDDPTPSPGTTTPPPTAPATEPPATAPPPTTSTATDPTTTPMSPDEQAIRDTIDGFWRTWLAANNPPNPDHPDLARYFTGPALVRARESIATAQRQGHIARLPENTVFHVTIEGVVVNGNDATAEVCIVDDGVIVDAASGSIIDDRTTSNRASVVLQFDGTVWRVSRNDFTSKSPGTDGCER